MESTRQFSLLKTRRFLPLFVVQLLGAFNDNLFKNAMIVLVAYKIATSHAEIIGNIMGICFILPFFIFSSTAGLLSDQIDKSRIIRWVKLAEVGVCLFGFLSVIYINQYLFMLVLFLLGMQSAFFGPAKYSILPQHLHVNELVGGNALIESSTFLAILLGTIVGGGLIAVPHGAYIVGILAMIISVIGWAVSYYVLPAPSCIKRLPNQFNIFKQTKLILSHTRRQRPIFQAIMGISWFWLVGVIFLTQIPYFVKNYIHGSVHMVTFFLALFSLGVGIGSLVCNKLLQGKVSNKYVPFALLFMSIFIIDLYWVMQIYTPAAAHMVTMSSFLSQWTGLRISIDLLLISIFGGIYTVPLYAFIQHKSSNEFRSRAIACNNILNSAFMVIGLACASGLIWLGLTLPQVFAVLGVSSFLVSLYIFRLIPDAIIKVFIKWILQKLFRVSVSGLNNYEDVKGKAIIVANHCSFLDPALLAAFLPDRVFFAVNSNTAKKWWMRIIMRLADTFTIKPSAPMSMKTIIHQVKRNRKCVIFPEGRITMTGSLMKVYEGPGIIADKTNAPLIPIRIEGAQYSHFSRLRNKVSLQWFPKISITILPAHQLRFEHSSSRIRRKMIGLQLYDVMVNLMLESVNLDVNLVQRLFEIRKLRGGSHILYEDHHRMPMSYNALMIKASVVSHIVSKITVPKERVAIMLPTLNITAVLFFSIHFCRRIPAMLNFTSGVASVISACHLASIKTIISSREFIEKSNLQSIVDGLIEEGIHLVWLEDLPKQASFWIKFKSMMCVRYFPQYSFKRAKNIPSNDPAVVLFSSGSEGSPKAVVLTHRNLISNIFQLLACSDFNPGDIVFNFLPVFHSFGLTAGTLLPAMAGVRAFLYPNPLHFRIIPELIYDTNATIVFASNTFLKGLARFAHPYDFYSVRSVYAGAEKLQPSTAKYWLEHYGVRVFEGYGVTETSPVVSVNTAMSHKIGSVGRLLPSIRYRLEAVEGISEGGRLYLKGPNIMLGYIDPKDSHQYIHPPGGWHDTGDIVRFDQEGFMYIIGRAKRFAKVSGEMISLAAIEGWIYRLWPDFSHAVVSIPDPARGEKLILWTTNPDPSQSQMIHYAKQHGIAELTVPKSHHVCQELPCLGTGKTDYVSIQKHAAEENQSDEEA